MASTLPVDSSEKRMAFKRFVAIHSQTRLWLKLKKLTDEVLEMLVLDLGRPLLYLTASYLIVDNLFSVTMEGRPATGHLVDDHTKGPEVTECAGLSPVEHLRCHVEGRTNE